MKKFLVLSVLCSLIACSSSSATKEDKPEEQQPKNVYRNPVIDYSLPDPSVIEGDDGYYYLYATEDIRNLPIHRSKNLVDWDFVPAGFQRKPTDDDQCAPAAYVSGDTLFYTGSTYEGLAVWYSTHPKTGRFKRAIEKNVLPSWDPCLFLDDDGRLYLYYGSSNEYPLKAVELDRNDFYPISKIHDVMMLRPEEHGWERFGMNNDDEVTLRPFTEGAYMTKHNGKYYFMWSEGDWTGPDYCVAYAIADSPFGPFKRVGKILEQDTKIANGAGHHSIIKGPGKDEWYIVYHRRPLGETDGNYRITCIDRMYFNKNGTIKPVKMTSGGIKARPLR